MTIGWYYELVEMLFRNVSMLLMSLIVCTIVSCKYHRKPKDPKFIDENDPHANTLYNIKTDIAFPKRVLEEKRQNHRIDTTAMSWSHEYESNMPPDIQESEPSSLDPQNLLPQQMSHRLQK